MSQDVVSAYNIRAETDELSPYTLIHGIWPTHISRNISSCPEIHVEKEDIIDIQNKNDRSSDIVQMMAGYYRQATRTIPWKRLHEVPLKVGERVIMACLYHHTVALEQKWMGPCTITKIEGVRCELVDNRGKRSRVPVNACRL